MHKVEFDLSLNDGNCLTVSRRNIELTLDKL